MAKTKCGHNEICQKFVAVEATRCEVCGVLHLKFETTEPFTIKDQREDWDKVKVSNN